MSKTLSVSTQPKSAKELRGLWHGEIKDLMREKNISRQEAMDLRRTIIDQGGTVEQFISSRPSVDPGHDGKARRGSPIQIMQAASALMQSCAGDAKLAAEAITSFNNLSPKDGE